MNPILINIKQDRPGFERFIGSWVCQADINILVDVGPANSVSRLIESLEAMNVDRVDFVLLSHIHIDHAGGLAYVLKRFPMANVICHDKGIGHLSDPSKLWAGSRKALGELAEFYGAINPVKQEKLIPHTEASIKDLEIIETPGHAPHHLSFSYKRNLFVGEAGGTYVTVQGKEYLRPAAPPKFFLRDCLKSVDQLLALEDQPIRYAHFGENESSHQMLNRFRDQLKRWEEIIKKEMSEGKRPLVERCTDRLLEEDPELKAFHIMEPDTQKREAYFLANAVSGFVEFLENE
jgi:glyoxylase-like metal-dependent hydrolase (beta-lactamase superfamily II)